MMLYKQDDTILIMLVILASHPLGHSGLFVNWVTATRIIVKRFVFSIKGHQIVITRLHLKHRQHFLRGGGDTFRHWGNHLYDETKSRFA